MLNYLPFFMRKSKVYQEIFQSDENQLTYLQTSLEDVKNQLNIDTATWALSIYEAELNIHSEISKPLNERRSVIKSKLRGANGSVNRLQIKLVVDAYTNGDVEVSFDGKIHVEFTATRGIPPNMNDVVSVLEELKPAHLEITFIYLYTTWDRFDSFHLTWDEMDALNKSWDEIEVM